MGPIIQKINSMLGFFCRLLSYVDKKIIDLFYESLNQIWNMTIMYVVSIVRRILVVEHDQSGYTQIIPGIDRLLYKDRLQKLWFTTLETCNKCGDILGVHIIMTFTDTLVNENFVHLASRTRQLDVILYELLNSTVICMIVSIQFHIVFVLNSGQPLKVRSWT